MKKKDLIALIVEYIDVDIAVHKFSECKNCAVKLYEKL